MKRLALGCLAVVLASRTASAQILLNDNFNNENGGTTALNYNAFANWSVTGQVDYVNGFPGISCVGGTGGCIDLDGSSGPGTIRTLSSFSFIAGQTMRITFDLSGNQRGGSDDSWTLALNFTGAPTGTFSGFGGFAGVGGGPINNLSLFSSQRLTAPDAPFASYGMDFTAASAGTVRYSIGTTSADNFGPIVDNVVVGRWDGQVLAQDVVPEPSTWAMLAFGLGAMGLVARRRVREQ